MDFRNSMKNIVVGLLLLVSKPVLCALEAKITQADMDQCRALMLDDGLKTLLAADGSLKYRERKQGSPWSASRLSCKRKKNEVKSGKIVEDDMESDAWSYSIAMSSIGRGKFLLMETVRDEQSVVASFTPRGKLIHEHKKIHPARCSCDTYFLEDNKVNFGYSCSPDLILWNARALYTTEEVQSALDIMLKNISVAQQGIFPGRSSKKLLLPENFKKNLSCIEKLFES